MEQHLNDNVTMIQATGSNEDINERHDMFTKPNLETIKRKTITQPPILYSVYFIVLIYSCTFHTVFLFKMSKTYQCRWILDLQKYLLLAIILAESVYHLCGRILK